MSEETKFMIQKTVALEDAYDNYLQTHNKNLWCEIMEVEYDS